MESTDLLSEQNFTQPPARFTEASLVKDLEEKDIGRPSTYAPIIATIIDRKYVTREKKTLIPTELGFIVTQIILRKLSIPDLLPRWKINWMK